MYFSFFAFIYLFSTCFFSFSKISFGCGGQATFSRNLRPYPKPHDSSRVLRLWKDSDTARVGLSSGRSAVMSTLTASVVTSDPRHFVGTSFGMDGHGDTAFRIDCSRTCGKWSLWLPVLAFGPPGLASLHVPQPASLRPPSRSHGDSGPVRCSSFLSRVGSKGRRTA